METEPDGIDPVPAAELDESPFVTLWEAPRATIRRLVATNPFRHVNALFLASGAVGACDTVPRLARELPVSPLGVALIAFFIVALSVPFGHLNAWYKWWVGRMLGGRASRGAVVTVAAWSGLPMIVGHGVILLIQVALYGLERFQAVQPTIEGSSTLLQLTFSAASVLFTAWAIVVSIVGFADVNGFSIWRSIGTSVLAVAIVIVSFAVSALALIVLISLVRDQ